MRELGLVTSIVPTETLLESANATAQALAEKPAEALRATKRLLKQATAQTTAAQIAAEAQEFVALLQSPDAKEAFAAFFEKRKPIFNKSATGQSPVGHE